MIDRRRFSRRRGKPELLGLSTLDTVCCALAGAIVLMIVMAATTPSKATVVLTSVREVFQSGRGLGGDDQPPTPSSGEAGDGGDVRNLAVLFLDFDRPVALAPKLDDKCDLGLDPLSDLGAADEQFQGVNERERHALVIWAKKTPTNCDTLTIELGYGGIPPPGCNATLVSGGHYREMPKARCRGSFRLEIQDEGVLQFARGQ